MAFVNRRAKLPQPLGDRRRLQIRARNGVAGRKQHFGNAAHAAAADADQVNALEIAECDVHGRATSSSRSTISSTARGFASDARAIFHFLDSPGLVQERKNFVRQALGRQLVLRQQAGRAGVLHGCGIARLVGVGGGPEGDEDGGASGGGYFRDGDRARPADDQVRLGKPLRHIFDEGDDLRLEFAPRISHSNRIIVAFAGLMHDEKLIFSRRQPVERVDDRAIDRQSAPAAAGDQDIERRAMLFAPDREEFRAHRAAGDHRLCARIARPSPRAPPPRAWPCRTSTRFVNPGSTFGSNTTVGIRCSAASSIIGPGSVAAHAERRVQSDGGCRICSESHSPAGSIAALRNNFAPPMPFSPAARINSSGKPACGTSFASIPRSVPTNTTRLLWPFTSAPQPLSRRRPAPETHARRCRRPQSVKSSRPHSRISRAAHRLTSHPRAG